MSSTASDDSILVASGLTGKSYNFILRDTEEDSRYLMVLQVLNWMCLEYARCLNTLKQAAVQHKCIMVGREELKPAHTELMVMQLDREFFSLLFSSFLFPQAISILNNYMHADLRLNLKTIVYMKALVHGDVRI